MNRPIFQFQNIEKSFFGVPVLKDVSFDIPDRGIVGLIGENGAGKSTLMNIMGGVLPADAGAMSLDGISYQPASPSDATAAGIAFIHQELNLFPNISVAENLFLTSFPQWSLLGLSLIHRKLLHQKAANLLSLVNLQVSPHTPVERLSAGERQLVEIAKALGSDARLIILDEPTTSLSDHEKTRLFELIRQLQERGIAMVYISHNLQDVMQLCDDIVVLRDGAKVAGDHKDAFGEADLVRLMVGRELQQRFPVRAESPGDQVLLEVRNVSQPGMVRSIDFNLNAGEILGITGLMGAGRTELAKILFGLDPCAEGQIVVNGRDVTRASTIARIQAGLSMLTEDRRTEGLMMESSIVDNMALVSLRRYCSTYLKIVQCDPLGRTVEEQAEQVNLRSRDLHSQTVKTLSGGNQQKVVLAKWLMNKPGVFILDEPTRGIDVGAKYEVYKIINRLATGGAGVLLISSEIEELIGMCDRIMVMRQGKIRQTFERSEFEQESVLRAGLHG